MMTHGRKCEIVANYIADNMDHLDLVEFVVDTLYQQMKHSNMLEEYMSDCGLNEQHLEELGGV